MFLGGQSANLSLRLVLDSERNSGENKGIEMARHQVVGTVLSYQPKSHYDGISIFPLLRMIFKICLKTALFN